MAFRSAAYAVVARVFRLLDSNGFTRVFFGSFVRQGSTYWGLRGADPLWTDPDTDAGIGFMQSVAPNESRAIMYANGDAVNEYAQVRVDGQLSQLTILTAEPTGPTFGTLSVSPASISLAPGGGDATYNGKQIATFETNTYDPVITNVNVGTTGSKVLRWFYVGGPDVGDYGKLTIVGTVLLNGAGFAITGTPVLPLPAGFNIAPITAYTDARTQLVNAGISAFLGAAQPISATQFQFVTTDDAVGGVSYVGINAAAPFVWGAGDFIAILVDAIVQRV